MALQPLRALIEAHVLAGLHGDDTTIPVLAKGKTVKGHIWTYVRDDRLFGGRALPAALYYASRSGGTNILSGIFASSPAFCRPTLITGTTSFTRRPACRGRSRRRCVGRTQGGSSSSWPILPPMPGVARRQPRSRLRWRPSGASICCYIERGINGLVADERLRVCKEQSAAVVTAWWPGCAKSAPACRARPPLPSQSTTCSSDGRICLTNNAAERALRGFDRDANPGCSPVPNAVPTVLRPWQR